MNVIEKVCQILLCFWKPVILTGRISSVQIKNAGPCCFSPEDPYSAKGLWLRRQIWWEGAYALTYWKWWAGHCQIIFGRSWSCIIIWVQVKLGYNIMKRLICFHIEGSRPFGRPQVCSPPRHPELAALRYLETTAFNDDEIYWVCQNFVLYKTIIGTVKIKAIADSYVRTRYCGQKVSADHQKWLRLHFLFVQSEINA